MHASVNSLNIIPSAPTLGDLGRGSSKAYVTLFHWKGCQEKQTLCLKNSSIEQEPVAAFRAKVQTITALAQGQKIKKHRMTQVRVTPVIHPDSFCTESVQTITRGWKGTNQPVGQGGDVGHLRVPMLYLLQKRKHNQINKKMKNKGDRSCAHTRD